MKGFNQLSPSGLCLDHEVDSVHSLGSFRLFFGGIYSRCQPPIRRKKGYEPSDRAKQIYCRGRYPLRCQEVWSNGMWVSHLLCRELTSNEISIKPHELLYSSLRSRGVGFTVNKEFDSQGLFVGAALTLSVSSIKLARLPWELKLTLLQSAQVSCRLTKCPKNAN